MRDRQSDTGKIFRREMQIAKESIAAVKKQKLADDLRKMLAERADEFSDEVRSEFERQLHRLETELSVFEHSGLYQR